MCDRGVLVVWRQPHLPQIPCLAHCPCSSAIRVERCELARSSSSWGSEHDARRSGEQTSAARRDADACHQGSIAHLKCPGGFVHSLSQQHVVSDDEQHARNNLAMP